MIRWTFVALALSFCAVWGAAPLAETPELRGKRFLLYRSYNPPTMRVSAYGNAWKHWGLKAKPAPSDYKRLFEERYGLHPAPFPNDGLPMGLRFAQRPGPFGGKGLTTDCLTCHGGSILGKSYVGLGNSTIDYHAFYAETNGLPGRAGKPPFKFTRVRGTTEAGGMSVYLLGHREPDLSLRFSRRDFALRDDLIEDTPAWWLLRKKKTMYHTGGADTRSARSLMQFMMSPLNFPSAFHKAESDFKDILAYLKSLEVPKYPLPLDGKLAARGLEVFTDTCARCHGTYGEKWTYPNRIVPIKDIGTDRSRFDGISHAFGEYYNKSWFAGDYKAILTDGYQAPPLDGIWATAPYLHNGSVPTLHAMLDSKTRPRVFTRSFRTGKEDFDPRHVGWKVKVLDRAPDPATMPAIEFRKIYDTTQPGRGNGGHTYGDKLSEQQRMALIEYLKTL